MKKIILTFSLCALAALLPAQVPITLGNANMPGSGDTLRYTTVQLGSVGNYTQTGTNFNWDFSNVISSAQGLRSFKSAFQTPYFLFFLSLNEYGEKIADTIGLGPFVINNYYNFYRKSTSPNAFIADGAGITFSNIPLPSYYSDKDELYNFPMSYPKYDSTSFRFATLSTTLIPVRYSKTGYRVTTVDGWGTVTTPYGTENCLRLVTTQYSMDSVKAMVGPVLFPLGVPNNQRSYQWLTMSSKIPYMEVSGGLVGGNFVPAQARYRGYPQLSTGMGPRETISSMQLFPNPVQDKLWITLPVAGPQTARVFDVQGRLVHQAQLEPGAESGYLDLSDLEPGIYIIKAGQDPAANYMKFIKN